MWRTLRHPCVPGIHPANLPTFTYTNPPDLMLLKSVTTYCLNPLCSPLVVGCGSPKALFLLFLRVIFTLSAKAFRLPFPSFVTHFYLKECGTLLSNPIHEKTQSRPQSGF